MYYEEGEDNLFQTGQADGLFIDTLSGRLNSCWLFGNLRSIIEQKLSLFLQERILDISFTEQHGC